MSEDERRQRFEAIISEVYEPLQRFLRRRCAPADADEALSDVLLVVWRRLDAVPRDTALPWCYGVARRVLANRRRSERRRGRLVERLAAHRSPPPSFDPAEADRHPELVAALAGLRPVDQEVLTLWAWEHLEVREIAVVLDITPNAVSLRLQRARNRLREAIRQEQPASGHDTDERTGDRR